LLADTGAHTSTCTCPCPIIASAFSFSKVARNRLAVEAAGQRPLSDVINDHADTLDRLVALGQQRVGIIFVSSRDWFGQGAPSPGAPFRRKDEQRFHAILRFPHFRCVATICMARVIFCVFCTLLILVRISLPTAISCFLSV
jgi:hypothetical protein